MDKASGKIAPIDFGGGREAAERLSPEGSSWVVGVFWREQDSAPVGLLVQRGFPTMTSADLIPWYVLPGRLRQQLTDLVRYSGFRFPDKPKVDPAQLRLPLFDEGPF